MDNNNNNNNNQLPHSSAKGITTAATQEVKQQLIHYKRTTQRPMLPTQRNRAKKHRGDVTSAAPALDKPLDPIPCELHSSSLPSQPGGSFPPSLPYVASWSSSLDPSPSLGGGATVAAASVAPSQPGDGGGATVAAASVAVAVGSKLPLPLLPSQPYPGPHPLGGGGGAMVGYAPPMAAEEVNPSIDMDTYHISQSGNLINLDKCGSIGDSIEVMKENGGPLWKRFAEAAQMPNDDAWKCEMNPTTGRVDIFRIRPDKVDDFVAMLKIETSGLTLGSTFRRYLKTSTILGPGGTRIPLLGVHYNEPSPQNQFEIGSKAMDKLPWIEFWAEHILPPQEKKIVSNTGTIVGSSKVGDVVIVRKQHANREISFDFPRTMNAATIDGNQLSIPVHNVQRNTLSKALKKKQMNIRSVNYDVLRAMGIDGKDLATKQMTVVEVIKHEPAKPGGAGKATKAKSGGEKATKSKSGGKNRLPSRTRRR